MQIIRVELKLNKTNRKLVWKDDTHTHTRALDSECKSSIMCCDNIMI